MTLRIDDAAAAFVDRISAAGEGSRADIINRALAREMRRRAAVRDAQIYAEAAGDADEGTYAAWAAANAAALGSELD